MVRIAAGIDEPDESRKRVSAKGCVATFIDVDAKVGVLVELNCESEFVAGSVELTKLAKDIAAHIAIARPEFISREDVSAAAIEREKEVFRSQATDSGMSVFELEEAASNRIEYFYQEVCLLEQRFMKDHERTVHQLIMRASDELADNITVRRFVRFQLGDKA